MKYLASLLIILLPLLSSAGYSQAPATGSIRGLIKTTDGKNAGSASIKLKGSKRTVLADDNGVFTIGGLNAGDYILLISLVGYESQEKAVTVQEGVIADVPEITLAISARALQTVEITGRKNTGYTAGYSFVTTKIAIPVTEIPNSVSTITQQLIRDRQAVRFDEVAKNANVRVTNNGRNNIIRGFDNRMRLINGLRTMSDQYRFSPISPVVESYEILKGPSSSMFGNMSPGGVLNLVTKKPLAEKKQSVSFSAGSFNTIRSDLDFTGKVNEEGTVLYRLNMAGQLSDTWYANMKDNAFVVAPSFSFLPAAGTRINVDINYTSLQTMENDGIFPFIGKEIDATPIDFTVLQIGDRNNTKTTSLNLSLSQKLGNAITFNVSYLKDYLNWDDRRHAAELYLGDAAWLTDSSISMSYSEWDAKMNADNITTYFTADFGTGGLKHKALLGYDYNTQLFNWGTYRYTPDATQVGPFNVYDPALNPFYDGKTYTLEAYTYDRVDKTKDYARGIYFQDQISIMERLKLLLALRYEDYTFRLAYQTPLENKVDQQAFIPKIGLTYNFPSLTHAYGSYVTGFEPVSSGALLFGTVEGGGELKPEYSDQFEVGVKQELFNKSFLLTLAAYQIRKKNVTQLTNPNVPNAEDRIWRQLGEVTSKGIELEFNGNMSEAVSISGAYAYNDAKISKDLESSKIGQRLGLAAQHQANLWVKYELLRAGTFNGLGLAAGFNASSRTPMLQAPESFTDGYTVMDAAISYRVNKISLQMNINNLLDKRYYTGAVRLRDRFYTGAPRNIMLRVGYSL